MLKNKTNITAEVDITILNNDTEYNELHSKVFGKQESLWWCELPHYFEKQEEGFG